MDLYSIASGSSGNCVYVGDHCSGILMDTGISMKRINQGLEDQGLSFDHVKAVFVTHEHSDHVCGLGPVLRKYKIPVYGTEETLMSVQESGKLDKVDSDLFNFVQPNCPVSIEHMEVMPFSISHDARNPVCYTFSRDDKKIGVATDMGMFSDYTVSHLEKCNALLLEANHDINMLQVGPYTFSLKRRILGQKGHLSNDSSARLISYLLHDNLKNIVLGHLSQENNTPQLAYLTVKYELEQLEEWNDMKAELSVAKRSEPSQYISI